MTKIPVTVDTSCAKHPLLFAHIVPGQTIEIEISPQELFAYATLKFQDPKIEGKRSFRQTKKKWRNILEREGDYLRFAKSDLIAKATTGSEDLTDLSAIVGIGCGLIALNHAFDVTINRFKRFKPSNKVMRRMDFEFIEKGRRYFHESKGTTSKYQGNADRKEILQQKLSTAKDCAKNGLKVKASSGSIVVYRKAKAQKGSTKIMLVDPPSNGDDGVSAMDELIAVLNYYHNIYAVTHTDYIQSPANGTRRLSLATWLARVIRDLNDGGTPPANAPGNLTVRRRLSEIGYDGSRYGGTIFDERVTAASIRKFTSFDHATLAIRSPVRFVGLSDEVTDLITTCRWEQLLEYRDSGSSVQRREGTAILTSGLMVRDLSRSQELEDHSRHEFELLRKIALRTKHLSL